jgi:hypothetical protein
MSKCPEGTHKFPNEPAELSAADLVYGLHSSSKRRKLKSAPTGASAQLEKKVQNWSEMILVQLTALAMTEDNLIMGEVSIADATVTVQGFLLNEKTVVIYFEDGSMLKLLTLFTKFVSENKLLPSVVSTVVESYFTIFADRLLTLATKELQQAILGNPAEESWLVTSELKVPLT